MITHEDQMSLFRLISKSISKDIECYAFGGTAMMFYGYKDETKDIDLLFENINERNEFINSIKLIGFTEYSPFGIYIPEKLRDKNRPLIYKRDDSRFDIFVKKIFHTIISPKMKGDMYAVHDFKGKYNLSVKVLRKEFIVLLKAVTERDKDFEDILKIIKKEKIFDWQYFIDEVIWQYNNGDKWILLDTEKMMKELKNYVFIEEKYFRQIYGAKGEIKD